MVNGYIIVDFISKLSLNNIEINGRSGYTNTLNSIEFVEIKNLKIENIVSTD